MNEYDEFAADHEGLSLDEIEELWQSGGIDPFADDYQEDRFWREIGSGYGRLA